MLIYDWNSAVTDNKNSVPRGKIKPKQFNKVNQWEQIETMVQSIQSDWTVVMKNGRKVGSTALLRMY